MSEKAAIEFDEPATLGELWDIAVTGRRVELSPESIERMNRARDTVEEWMANDRDIYGLTTGFGPLATERIPPEKTAQLQSGLVEHLASGVGDPMPRRQVRAMMTARLATLIRGHSAARPRAAQLMVAFLNNDITPVVPSIGTVGASGDLTPLAHMARTLMGRGEIRLGPDEPRRDATAAFERIDGSPLEPSGRDALALVNGTAATAGICALNAVEAKRSADIGCRLALFNAEIFHGRLEAWDERLGELRPHSGQQSIHKKLTAWTESSRRLAEHSSNPPQSQRPSSLPQDRYSVRCIPQIYGAVVDVIEEHNQTVATELNSVSDNPVIDLASDRAIHGGNFYGQHLAFASDHLASALLKVGIHAERVVSRLCDPADNDDLPPFLQPNDPGLQSGFMGAQVTATSLVAEMRTRGTPAATQSIPTNADNQDVVPMATTAARRAAHHLERLWELLAIEALTLTQAFDLCGGFENDEFSDSSSQLARTVRDVSPKLVDDRALSNDIQRVAAALRERER